MTQNSQDHSEKAGVKMHFSMILLLFIGTVFHVSYSRNRKKVLWNLYTENKCNFQINYPSLHHYY